MKDYDATYKAHMRDLRIHDCKARRRRANLPNPLPRPANVMDAEINYQQRRVAIARR
jgi:hypothetical protein